MIFTPAWVEESPWDVEGEIGGGENATEMHGDGDGCGGGDGGEVVEKGTIVALGSVVEMIAMKFAFFLKKIVK